MSKIKIILSWIGTIFFSILVCVGGFSAVPFSLLVLNIIPIKKWQAYKRSSLKLNSAVSVVIGIILFVVGMLTFPKQVNSDIINDDSSSAVIATTTELTTTVEKEECVSETEESLLDVKTTDLITTVETTEKKLKDDSTFSIHYINVGQADAALIECDSHYMLIDGGNKDDSDIMYSVLRNEGVTNLDIVVGTHAHQDHIGGLPGALNYATADLVLCPVTDYDSDAFNDFKRYANSKSNGITIPNMGDIYQLGSADVIILGVNCSEDENNTSIVLMIEYGTTKFLFSGDAEYESEQVILSTDADLSCDILKVGHHGSDTSTSYIWLNKTMPKYAVISVGQNNSFAHPTDEVLSRLRDSDVTTFRTDLNGDIYAYSDGNTITITTTKTAKEDEIFTAGSTPQLTPTSMEDSQTNMSIEVVHENPTTYYYIVNTNTGKFHYTSCSSVKKIKEDNRRDFNGTRQELIDMGYKPCKNCNP